MRADNANVNPTLYEPPALQETQPESKDEFLRLLVAQMQHQDPLDPQDGSEFVAQLAQFANIEIGVEANTRLASIEAGQVSASRAAMMGLVGKSITADASSVRLTGSGPMPDLQVNLDDNATNVDVFIYDDLGNKVAQVEAGNQSAGEFTLEWDGTDDNGVMLPAGDYTMEVIASNGEDGIVEASLSLSGATTSIEFTEDGSTLLGLGGLLIAPGSILTVEDGT